MLNVSIKTCNPQPLKIFFPNQAAYRSRINQNFLSSTINTHIHHNLTWGYRWHPTDIFLVILSHHKSKGRVFLTTTVALQMIFNMICLSSWMLFVVTHFLSIGLSPFLSCHVAVVFAAWSKMPYFKHLVHFLPFAKQQGSRTRCSIFPQLKHVFLDWSFGFTSTFPTA